MRGDDDDDEGYIVCMTRLFKTWLMKTFFFVPSELIVLIQDSR